VKLGRRPEAPALKGDVLEVTIEEAEDREHVELTLPDGHRVFVYSDTIRVIKPRRPGVGRTVWTSQPK
jgi:hypothetical protein